MGMFWWRLGHDGLSAVNHCQGQGQSGPINHRQLYEFGDRGCNVAGPELAGNPALCCDGCVLAPSSASRPLPLRRCGRAPRHLPCLQDNFFYRTAAHRLYPVIADYADPALDKLVHSPYYSAVVDHLKPAPEAAMPHKALCV